MVFLTRGTKAGAARSLPGAVSYRLYVAATLLPLLV